jgi:arginine N-succinyltransferase
MVIIRPVTLDDLDQLLELAKLTGYGLTTLPKDRELLRRRIRASRHGFDSIDDLSPRGEPYLFVMEDLRTGSVVGTSGVVAKVGGFEPFYAYKVETSIIESKMLNVRKEIKTLHLVLEHNGPCEIGSLFLRPEYRGGGNGRLLSLARFLFMAEHHQHFDPMVIAEMRGVLDEQGRSAFWDALGRQFFEIDYPTADYLSMVNKRFIADLMPRHPIYVALLPAEAQAVIGQVHQQTKPALKILEDEGFQFNGMVDIFEAGPMVSSPLDEIRSVKQSVRADIVDVTDEMLNAPEHVISTTSREMRACRGPVEVVAEGGVRLNGPTALALGVKVGQSVRYLLLRSEGKKEPSA